MRLGMRVLFDQLPQYSDHVLVDGAFDPLHAGHIAYLNAARALNKGPLLCAVASDDQIREKGRSPLLPQESRVAVMEALCDAVFAKDRPTEDVLLHLTPVAYVKGWDWRDRLPTAQTAMCELREIPILFVDTAHDSSTARLRAWALADADRSLDRLATSMAVQAVTPPERYDAEYFAGNWRADGNRYTLEARRHAEGRHPKIIKELFGGWTVLDAGCGPGFLVHMLRELGMDVLGVDPSPAAVALRPFGTDRVIHRSVSTLAPHQADLVICREVLEHLPVREVADLVRDLFRIAKKAVYITTRFHAGPIFDVTDEREVDPTHQTLLTQPFLRSLCVLNGGTRRRDWEAMLDWQQKGRVLCYEVTR